MDTSDEEDFFSDPVGRNKTEGFKEAKICMS